MREGSARTNVLTIGALAVAAVLLSCTSAFASPSIVATPAAYTSSQDASSAIQTPIDPQTQQFRDQLALKQAQLETLKSQLASMEVEYEIAEQQWVQVVRPAQPAQ